ncbi:RNA polymerase II-associated protein 3 [Condylostylus longicornis]|uniref:RNA polymerase II-associated protein 3 n=1 Tax=Condylostylus longicornis TaxID=2530218 RepID=UPI00244E0CDF|nr:RNA polymerase II-associated protein 3 [Condylostylus longicornis]
MDSHIKAQYEVKAQSEETRASLQDLYNWQEEMKEKEKARLKGGQSEDVQIPPVRSEIQNNADTNASNIKKLAAEPAHKNNGKFNTNELNKKSSGVNLSKQNEGDLCKEEGNNLVKVGKYDEALYFYTAAIQHFDKEPIYFTNRALCYLRLEKYKECIKDCDQAIHLNKTNIKAYYRRMQAYEFLGENEDALKDCQNVLNLDPKNSEAKLSHQRILNRIKKVEMDKGKNPTFTKVSENVEEIEMFNKPPHLRSKKLMKKVKIREVINGKPMQMFISDDVIDKLFTNNNIGAYEEIKKNNKMQDKASIHDINADNNKNKSNSNENKTSINKETTVKTETENEITEKISPRSKKLISDNTDTKINSQNSIDKLKNKKINLTVPTSPNQFHATWKELDSEQRYTYLKMIPVGNLSNILGAGVELETLIEIYKIIHDYYLKDNLEIIEILKELVNTEQFFIKVLFLSNDDRELLLEFVKYMKKRNNNPKDIEYIEQSYHLVDQMS